VRQLDVDPGLEGQRARPPGGRRRGA
jgi:hypothetical protein